MSDVVGSSCLCFQFATRIYDLTTGKLLSTTAHQTTQTSTTGGSSLPGSPAEMGILDAWRVWHASSVVSALAYSPDGQKLLFGTSDGVVKLWNLKTGEILNFEREKTIVTGVGFTGGGNNVLVRDLSDTIQIFNGDCKLVSEVKLRSGE